MGTPTHGAFAESRPVPCAKERAFYVRLNVCFPPIADVSPLGGLLDMRRSPKPLLSHTLGEWGRRRKTPCRAQS
jgi:hypothetical protein